MLASFKLHLTMIVTINVKVIDVEIKYRKIYLEEEK